MVIILNLLVVTYLRHQLKIQNQIQIVIIYFKQYSQLYQNIFIIIVDYSKQALLVMLLKII